MVCSYFHSRNARIKLRPDVFEVSTRLVKRGHKVVALASEAFGAPSHEFIEGVEVHRFPSLSFPGIFYFVPSFPNLLSKILKICDEQDIQIVHFWNYEYLTSAVAFFLKRRLNSIPLVLTVIGYPGLNWRYGIKIIDTVGLAYTYTLGRAVLRAVDHVVVLGPNLVRYAEWMGVDDYKVSTCPLGIDLKTFRATRPPEDVRNEFGISPSDKVIIFVGRLEHVKGIARLLKVANSLSNRFQNLKFLIVGDGPLRSKLSKYSNPHIIFTGWRNDVADLINASDIFVLPSISEGLPMSILEAYALAKPVIATNVGVISDLVINSETGLLVSPENDKRLEEGIVHLMQNPGIAHEMGVAGQMNVVANYNWDSVIESYERLYVALTRSRSQAHNERFRQTEIS